MSAVDPSVDPDEYVRENIDSLVHIIKHGDDKFVRSLSLAAIVEYGDDPEIEQVKNEIQKLDELIER